MKRFTVLTTIFSLSTLVVWAILLVLPGTESSGSRKYDNTPVLVYDATGAMQEAIQAGSAEQTLPVTGGAISPVYDATGVMLEAIDPNEKVTTLPAYDATGAMLAAIEAKSAAGKIVPVYDATGAMLEAINP